MISLTQETEALAYRVAAAQHLPFETAIQVALETVARSAGINAESRPRRRLNVAQILAVGSGIAARPVLDPRSPCEIMGDLNA